MDIYHAAKTARIIGKTAKKEKQRYSRCAPTFYDKISYMRCSVIVASVIFLLFVGPVPCPAQNERDTAFEIAMTKGIMELESGNPAAAVEFLTQARAAKPGDRNAVLSLGIAYSRSGDLQKAQESLQQALGMDPSDPRAQYELGIVLLRTGSDERARELFGAAAASAKADENLKWSAQVQLEQPAGEQKSKGLTISIQAGIEYDSNVILEPSVPVTPAGGKQADWSAVATAAALYRTPMGSAGSAEGGYQFYQSLHASLDDFNVQQHILRAAAGYRRSDTLTLGAKYAFLYTLLGGDRYSSVNELMLFMEPRFTPMSATQFRYLYQKQDYDNTSLYAFNSERSGKANTFGITHAIAAGQGLSLSASYDYASDSADRSYWSSTEHHVQIGARKRLGEFLLLGSVSYRDQRYDDPMPGYQDKRHDGIQEYTVSLVRNLQRNISITLGTIYIINDSNLAAFEYTRSITGLYAGMQL